MLRLLRRDWIEGGAPRGGPSAPAGQNDACRARWHCSPAHAVRSAARSDVEYEIEDGEQAIHDDEQDDA